MVEQAVWGGVGDDGGAMGEMKWTVVRWWQLTSVAKLGGNGDSTRFRSGVSSDTTEPD